MWSNRFFEVLRGRIVRAFEAGFRPQNARKWAILGEKQRKKEILANLLFGRSVHNRPNFMAMCQAVETYSRTAEKVCIYKDFLKERNMNL